MVFEIVFFRDGICTFSKAQLFLRKIVLRSPKRRAPAKGSAVQVLKRGVTISCHDHRGITPLHSAASSGHVETTELLLNRNADVDIA